MYRSSALARLLATGVFLAFANGAAGQTLVVRPIQNLTFGFLLPGVPTTVDAAQITLSGQIQVEAAIGTSFEIRYVLPTAMTGQGQTLPLTFGNNTAGAAPSANPAAMIRFNPANPARFQLVTTNRATFFLGGRATPRNGQLVGAYTAPIVVTITNLGI